MNKLVAMFLSVIGMTVWGEGLFVGTKETVRLDVNEGTVTRSPAFIDVDGRLDKTGAGTLEIPLAGIWQNGPFSVVVREGLLTLSQAAAPAWETPTATLEKAAFWVHAGKGLVVSNDTFVYEWSDVRDGSSSPVAYDPENPVTGRQHLYAKARWDLGTPANRFFGIAPNLVQRSYGPALYFNGYGEDNSCQYMRWMNTDGTPADLTDVTDIFLVFDCVSTFGQVISYGTDPNDMQFGASKALSVATYSASAGDNALALLDGAIVTYNGERISPRRNIYTGLQVLGMQFAFGRKPHVGAFFAERPDKVTGTSSPLRGRCGGDYLSEVLVFTNRLTAVERMQVQQYLHRKWGLAYARPAVNLTMADDAQVGISVNDGDTGGTFAGSMAIAGNGTFVKSGNGRLDLGLDSDIPAIAIADGSVRTRKPEGLRVAANTTVTATEPVWKEEWSAGTDLSVASGGSDGTVTKAGLGLLTVDRFDNAVTKVNVTAGTLSLGVRQPKAGVVIDPVYPTNVVYTAVVLTNAGFEAAAGVKTGTGINYILPRNKTAAFDLGWWGKQNADTTQNAGVGFCSTVLSKSLSPAAGDSNWPTGGYDAPEGEWVLSLKSDASAWTFFEVEQAGYYELRFKTCARTNYDSGKNRVSVRLGACPGPTTDPTPGDIPLLGTIEPRQGSGFVENGFSKIWLEAGRTVLYFQTTTYNTDRASSFDDIRLVLIEKEGKVPFGDFELTVGEPQTTTRATQILGWELETTNVYPNSAQYTSIQACLTDSRHSTNPRFYPSEEALYGKKGLLFLSTGGVAKTVFTPPAGEWKLSCRARRHLYSGSPITDCTVPALGVPKWRAVLQTNGVEFADLGQIAQEVTYMTSLVWPVSFVGDGETPVTLVLWQTAGLTGGDHGAGVLDDLDLVAANQATDGVGEELVRNGSFETGDGEPTAANWTFVTHTDTNPMCKSKRQQNPSGTLWGNNTGYDGSWVWRVTQNGAAHQNVTIPADGIYRLSFRGLARHDDLKSGFNPVNAWLYDAATSKTTEIGRAAIASTNFCGHVFYFRAKAGAYQLWLQGDVDITKSGYTSKDDNDRNSLVDCVSLVRAEYLEDQAPTVPADLEVRVAEGAKLSLDFGGRITLGRLRLGGRAVSGEISRAKRPDLADYLTGPGEVYVAPKGCIMLVR